MKQELDETSREALINYRLQRAKGTLREADILLEQHCYNAVVNRLYYFLLSINCFNEIFCKFERMVDAVIKDRFERNLHERICIAFEI